MVSSKKISVIVLASVAAAAAGVAVVVTVAKWREQHLGGGHGVNSLRGVQDVLSDCYRKIDEIERNLPVQANEVAHHNNGSAPATLLRALTNGKPALESGA